MEYIVSEEEKNKQQHANTNQQSAGATFNWENQLKNPAVTGMLGFMGGYYYGTHQNRKEIEELRKQILKMKNEKENDDEEDDEEEEALSGYSRNKGKKKKRYRMQVFMFD